MFFNLYVSMYVYLHFTYVMVSSTWEGTCEICKNCRTDFSAWFSDHFLQNVGQGLSVCIYRKPFLESTHAVYASSASVCVCGCASCCASVGASLAALWAFLPNVGCAAYELSLKRNRLPAYHLIWACENQHAYIHVFIYVNTYVCTDITNISI